MRYLMATAVLLLAPAITTSAYANTWYILPDGTGDAPTIQAGIDSAFNGDEVVLADGTFTGEGNRDIDYHGKAIIVRSQSNDPGVCVIDCQGLGRGFDFHSDEGSESVLEAVTITNGSAPESYGKGGGIRCSGASPTLTNCTFSGNSARHGGGMFCQDNPHSLTGPTLTGCTFSGNSAALAGGGMACWGPCATLTNCTFSGNSAGVYGGGMSCGLGSPTLTNCTFSGNNSGDEGGGMDCEEASPTLLGCTFSGNSAASAGGGMFLFDASATLTSCIIAFSADGAAISCYISTAILACCDIYSNADGDWTFCIADQYGVDGNFSADPLFCDPDLGDFTLHSNSPCAPGNHPDGAACGLIGALGVGCGPTTATEQTSWGEIKSMFR